LENVLALIWKIEFIRIIVRYHDRLSDVLHKGD